MVWSVITCAVYMHFFPSSEECQVTTLVTTNEFLIPSPEDETQ